MLDIQITFWKLVNKEKEPTIYPAINLCMNVVS